METAQGIKFRRTDYSIPEVLFETGKEIADHFKTPRNYVPEFCGFLINTSRWDFAHLPQQLATWRARFQRISGTGKIINLVEKAFNACTSNDDINVLRGLLLEAMVVASYGGTQVLSQDEYGWGAKVYVNGSTRPVRYTCVLHRFEDCKGRATVDFGAWDGHNAMLYECKVQPFRIGCKELHYMKELTSVLQEAGTSHEIFFVSAASRDDVEIQLAEQEANLLFKPLGLENFRECLTRRVRKLQ